MSKAIIILLSFIIFRTMISCCKKEGYNFRWSDIAMSNLNVEPDRPTLLASDSIEMNKYGFRLSFQDERVSYNILHGFGTNNTYAAYDCWAIFQNKDSIQSIDVTTRFAFDNSHPAGSSISEYILARPTDFYNYYPGYEYRPLNSTPLDVNLNYLNEEQINSIRNNNLDFKLQPGSQSTFGGPHRFIVTLLFLSGRILSDSISINLI